jgi:hypothetical protein
MPGDGVDRGNHPIRGDPRRDTPTPVGAIGALDGFHVLAGEQGPQCHRLGGPRTQLLLGQMSQQPVRIADQGVHQHQPAEPLWNNRGYSAASSVVHRNPVVNTTPVGAVASR